MARPLSILLVDDNRFDRELAGWALHAFMTPAPVIREAESWDEARPILEAGGVDVVLLDFNLPRMNGLEVLHELGELPDRAPVVMLTGQEDVATAVDTLRAGAADYVVKSLDWGPVLARTIERVLAHARLERQFAEARARLAAHASELEEKVAARTLVLRAQAAKIEQLYLRAEEATRLKAEIASNVSHELRTPLNVILGYTELLGDRVTDPDAGELLEKVRTHAERLRTLIESLLALERLNRGAENVDSTAFTLDDLVEELRTEAEVLNQERRLTVHWCTPPARPTLVHDRDKVHTIAYHLVTNALKFTPEGRVDVTFTSGPHGALTIRVADTGIGIRRESHADALEDFRQLDGSATRRHDGLGLGLGIVKRYAALLGGEVTIGETRGGGTTVVVELPPVRITPAADSP